MTKARSIEPVGPATSFAGAWKLNPAKSEIPQVTNSQVLTIDTDSQKWFRANRSDQGHSGRRGGAVMNLELARVPARA